MFQNIREKKKGIKSFQKITDIKSLNRNCLKKLNISFQVNSKYSFIKRIVINV